MRIQSLFLVGMLADVMHIKEELEARGWTQLNLAEILGRDPVQIKCITTPRSEVLDRC